MKFFEMPLAALAGGCLCAILASPLRAQGATDPLAAAIESAWQRATAAAQAQALRGRAQAERDLAHRWSPGSPSLELAARDDRWQRGPGARERELGVAWPLWLPGQRDAALAAADASSEAAQAQQRAARLRLAGEVRDAYWAAAAAATANEAARTQVEVLQRLTADVERRVAQGDLARTDALAAQGELLAAQAQAAEAEQARAAALASWQQLTALPLPGVEAAVPDLPLAAWAFNASRHPEQVEAEAAVTQAQARLAQARVSRREAPELGLAARQEMPGSGERSQGSVQLRVRVPLGSAPDSARQLAQAQGELAIAEAALRQTRERLVAQAALAQAALQSAAAQRALAQQRADRLSERARLIERSFAAGESSLAELLRALAAAGEAQAAHRRQQAYLGAAQARLNTALGVLP